MITKPQAPASTPHKQARCERQHRAASSAQPNWPTHPEAARSERRTLPALRTASRQAIRESVRGSMAPPFFPRAVALRISVEVVRVVVARNAIGTRRAPCGDVLAFKRVAFVFHGGLLCLCKKHTTRLYAAQEVACNLIVFQWGAWAQERVAA